MAWAAANLWGTTWGPTDANHVNFGAVLSGSAILVVTASADYERITISYEGSNRSAAGAGRMRCGDGMAVSDSRRY